MPHIRKGRVQGDNAQAVTPVHDAPDLYIPPARHGRQGKPRKDGKPSAPRSGGLR